MSASQHRCGELEEITIDRRDGYDILHDENNEEARAASRAFIKGLRDGSVSNLKTEGGTL